VLVEPEVRAVEEHVVEAEPRQVTGRELAELVLYLLADAADGRLRQRRFVTEHFSERRFDVTVRQSAHPRGDDERLEGVRPCHAETE
jgi:hypothetical protein